MECADRIAVLAAERTLEPVRAMEAPDAPSAVTARALLARRRFDVTVRKAWPQGLERPPRYAWEAREVERDGAPKPGGHALRGPGATDGACVDPEDAYWIALEAVRAAVD